MATSASSHERRRGARRRLPKLCGGDLELGNFVLGLASRTDTCAVASRLLLHEVQGIPASSDAVTASPATLTTASPSIATAAVEDDVYGPYAVAGELGDDAPVTVQPSTVGYNPQDQGRKFLASNGGCIYIDLNHLELCLPEVLSARDHVAAWCAMLRIARQAQIVANTRLPEHQRIQVLVNNSDGLNHSYGGHLNFLITRRAWNNLFRRKLHHALYLAAYQASSIVMTGQGKVGSENGRPSVGFQLSQRADFMETITGAQTTFHRPIVNSRDEALCGSPPGSGDSADMARLHCIFYDANLAEVATYLKVGVLQIVLAMIEAEYVNERVLLDDAVDAVIRWSHDPTLTATARTMAGRKMTALEMQYHFLEAANRFAERGGLDGIVPEFSEILALWEDTLDKLRARDLAALSRRLDWVLKYVALQRAMDQHSHLDWRSLAVKHLDQLFSSLDPAEGLFWAYDNAGLVDRLVPAERIAWFMRNPPQDTRAWTRAMVLRHAGASRVSDVNWDRIRLYGPPGDLPNTYRTLELPDPLGFHETATAAAFAGAPPVDEILDRLGVPEQDERSAAKPLVIYTAEPRGREPWRP